MTEEQQRIAIAEACGWTCCGCVEGCTPHGLSPSFSIHDYNFKKVMAMEVPIGDLPDYLNDLNAMHEAEKVLINEQDLKYSESLALVVKARWKTNNSYDMQKFRSATAAQRSEAFLKTIEKWEAQ